MDYSKYAEQIIAEIYGEKDDIKAKLEAALRKIKELEAHIAAKQSYSTRRRSLDKTKVGKMQSEVLNFVKENPGCTRFEITDALGFRHSSVVGRVNELINKDLVYTDGEKLDKDTKRMVEQLFAK